MDIKSNAYNAVTSIAYGAVGAVALTGHLGLRAVESFVSIAPSSVKWLLAGITFLSSATSLEGRQIKSSEPYHGARIPRMLPGEYAGNFDATFTAAIFDDGGFICSGSAIRPDFVLTAGHCVAGFYNDSTKHWDDLNLLTVGAGTDLWTMDHRNVTAVYIMPEYLDDFVLKAAEAEAEAETDYDYDPSIFDDFPTVQRVMVNESDIRPQNKSDDHRFRDDPSENLDVALLKLETPFSSNFKPIKIINSNKLERLKQTCPQRTGSVYSYGAGTKDTNGTTSDHILRGNVRLRSKCYINGLFRADSNEKRTKLCERDSGGPLTYVHPKTKKERQVAIAVAGFPHDRSIQTEDSGCDKGVSTSTFVAIQGKVRDFIEEHIPKK